jgi:hypothetical protein
MLLEQDVDRFAALAEDPITRHRLDARRKVGCPLWQHRRSEELLRILAVHSLTCPAARSNHYKWPSLARRIRPDWHTRTPNPLSATSEPSQTKRPPSRRSSARGRFWLVQSPDEGRLVSVAIFPFSEVRPPSRSPRHTEPTEARVSRNTPVERLGGHALETPPRSLLALGSSCTSGRCVHRWRMQCEEPDIDVLLRWIAADGRASKGSIHVVCTSNG